MEDDFAEGAEVDDSFAEVEALSLTTQEAVSPAALPPQLSHHLLLLPSAIPAAAAGGATATKGVEAAKREALMELLDAVDFEQAVIFVSCSEQASGVQKLLAELGLSTLAVHEAVEESQRAANCARFRGFEGRVLVATDVGLVVCDAALGKKVNLVINYDVPEDAEEYARCVSRAGLNGQPSFVISFAADAYEEASLTHFGRRLGVRFGESLN